jgi:acetyltransferase
LLSDFPEIVELDVNPVRVLESGEVLALDARMRVVPETTEGRTR